jgi:hypothetical protein
LKALFLLWRQGFFVGAKDFGRYWPCKFSANRRLCASVFSHQYMRTVGLQDKGYSRQPR